MSGGRTTTNVSLHLKKQANAESEKRDAAKLPAGQKPHVSRASGHISKQNVAVGSTHKPLSDISDLYEYMVNLSPEIWGNLYRDSCVVAAVYKSLPEIEQVIVVRLAFMKQPVSERLIRLWVQPNHEVLVKKTMANLRSKNVVYHKPTESEKVGRPSQGEVHQYLLQNDFQISLQNLILKGPSLAASSLLQTVTTSFAELNPPSLQDLQEYSKQQWDSLLRWMMSDSGRRSCSVDDTSSTLSSGTSTVDGDRSILERPCEDVVQILVRRNLVSADAVSSGGGMSREAFSWLLKDLQSQIGSVVVEFLMMLDDGALTHCAQDAKSRNASLKSSPKRHAPNVEDESAAAAAAVQDVVTLILSLSQSTIGQAFSTSVLKKSQMRFLATAADLGLIWRPTEKSSYFLAAPYSLLLGFHNQETGNLAVALSNLSVNSTQRYGTSGTEFGPKHFGLREHYIHPSLKDVGVGSVHRMGRVISGEATGTNVPKCANSSSNESAWFLKNRNSSNASLEAGIIVQSNFKVYVYTASALQVSILAHLCELQSRTPNLVVGLLTRESVLAAYKTGITADQIIRFLNTHAHPALHERRIKEGKPFLPDNVVMQLRMWEQERHRMKLQSVVVFKKWDKQFLPELYQRVVRYAITKGFLLYHTPWPENTNSSAYADWLRAEKYLAITEDAKEETVQEIRDVRNQLAMQTASTDKNPV